MKLVIACVISCILIASLISNLLVLREGRKLLRLIDTYVVQMNGDRDHFNTRVVQMNEDRDHIERSISAINSKLRDLAISQSDPRDRASRRQELTTSKDETHEQVIALFDGVGPYRKNGLLEEYGLDLRERRSGPIKVFEADLEIKLNDAWAIWSPDFSPAQAATDVVIDFQDFPSVGTISVGLLLEGRQGVVFSYDADRQASRDASLPASAPPADFVTAVASLRTGTFRRSGGQLRAALPDDVRAHLKSSGDRAIAHWFIRLQGASGEIIRIRSIALTAPISGPAEPVVTLSGVVKSFDGKLGTEIELIDEHGRRRSEVLSAEGVFSFTGVEPETPVSLRVRRLELLEFTTLGRWFIPDHSRSNLVVGPAPTYVNTDNHAPDLKTAKQIFRQQPSRYGAIYEPHTRVHWSGAGTVQEYDSISFTNNLGYVDRDRFDDNPDHCIRIGTTGGSENVAIQVEPMQKYNILLEEDLGILLDKCVEAFSASRENGDLGSNYRRIRDYFGEFDVSLVLMSTMPANVSTLNPVMLKDGIGWDPENSPFDTFYFEKDGELNFRAFAPDWPVFTSKPTLPEYRKGIPFYLTLAVPFADMPPEGKEAFRYLAAILRYIGQHDPRQMVILHTGLDQAQCRANCLTSISRGWTVDSRRRKSVSGESRCLLCEQCDYLHRSRFFRRLCTARDLSDVYI